MLLEGIVCFIISFLVIVLVTPQYYEGKEIYQRCKLAAKIPWLPFVGQDVYKQLAEENHQEAVLYHVFRTLGYLLALLGGILLGMYFL